MKRFAISLLIALTLASGASAQKNKTLEVGDLSGIWEAHGVIDGEPYATIVRLKKRGDGYSYHCVPGFGNSILGLAVRDGDSFIVSWTSKDGSPGLSIFKINEDGKGMSGRWMLLPGAAWESESLKWIAPLPVKKKLIQS